MDLRDVLAVVEHELRGIAATTGVMARLLIDGRLGAAEQAASYQRLQNASARLERMAADAGQLASWTGEAAQAEREWRTLDVTALLESVCGELQEPVAMHVSAGATGCRVRAADTSAFEAALGTLADVARRETGGALVCHLDGTDGQCEIFFGPAGAMPSAGARQPAAGRLPGGVRTLLARAILSVHGATLWRAADGTGLGISLPRDAAKPAGRASV
jgi:hypothetical protein